MPLPTFVIAGAQKSGTTTLHDLLGQLPDAWMSEPKELHFFGNSKKSGLDWYAQQFRPEPHHRAWGESTPSYLYRDRARDAMMRSLPEARFVVVLREPVSRAYSHFWFARSKGKEPLESFAAATDAEPGRLAASRHGQPAAYSYLDRGHYLRQLVALEEGVGRARIHVLLTEDLSAEPRATLRRVCQFLGLDEDGVDSVQLRRRNTFADQALSQQDRQQRGRVHPPAPESGDPTYPPIDPELEQRLRTAFKGENEALSRWLGRDLSAWMPA